LINHNVNAALFDKYLMLYDLEYLSYKIGSLKLDLNK